MAQFITLYSGSSGNSTLLRAGGKNILIDMGCSCKKTLGALYSLGIGGNDIDAVFVTHEHSDHIAGLATFFKHYKKAVLYAGERTLACLESKNIPAPHTACVALPFDTDIPLAPELSVRAFPTCHDSAQCVGFRFSVEGGRTVAIATDLGHMSDDVFSQLAGCSLVALESNYDDNLLLIGPYPYTLKSRIRSPYGHLSNCDCAAAAVRLAKSGTRRLVLMNLSQENNDPDLALTGCLGALENHGIPCDECAVCVAPRHEVGPVIEV